MTESTGTSKAAAPPAAAPIELLWDPDSVPPFPGIALKALHLMSGTDTSLPELCNLVRSDIAFSTAVLKIANSPLIAFSKEVTSVVQAAMLLGFRRLRTVVVTVGLRAYLKDSFTPLMKSCWHHSLACAIIAEQSAGCVSLDNDFAYSAGILHDIGRMALVTLMPGAYALAVERGADKPQDMLRVERHFCGIDYCQAGSSLVTTWNLPEAFLEIAAHHHDPEAVLPLTASLIAPSCALADAVGFAVVNYRTPRSYEEVLAEFPEPARRRFPADANDLASQIKKEIHAIERA